MATERSHLEQRPKRPIWQITAAVWLQCLTVVILVATAVALLSTQGGIREAADRQRIQRPDDLGHDDSPLMDEVMNDRFLVRAVTYLLIAMIYVGFIVASRKYTAVARTLHWTIGSLVTLLAVCWNPVKIWQPTHITYEAYDSLTFYVEDAMPTWLVIIEFWPLFVLIGGLIPIGLLLNAGSRAAKEQGEPAKP